LFMPVFFGMAGLSADLRVLAHPPFLYLTLGLIAVASIGKFSGALLGGRIGGLTTQESIAVGCGMNARGSTEIIIATFGLSMGALSRDLFTAIVTMAIVTTLIMPPMLRWAFGRLPLGEKERIRLDREEAEAQSGLARIERLLLTVDSSRTGQLASHLAGLLAGARGMPATALHLEDSATPLSAGDPAGPERTEKVVSEAAESGGGASAERDPDAEPPAERDVEVELRVGTSAEDDSQIAAEAKKGFGLLMIGREPTAMDGELHEQIARSASSFGGSFAIVSARGAHQRDPVDGPLRILVPVIGTGASRLGADLAVALAEASRGEVTALYIARANSTRRESNFFAWRTEAQRDTVGDAVIQEITDQGRRRGVTVTGKTLSGKAAATAILAELKQGAFNLLVSGVIPRPGAQLFLGEVAAALLAKSHTSLLFVSNEPASAAATDDNPGGDPHG
jgi:nucleotide-binding universal stress UspA family protein